MYAGDNNDTWPRNDECILNSSLNPALNTGTMRCSSASWAHRLNHFAWQKWVMPYLKNTDILVHPLRQRDPVQWSTHGQIVGGFALNIAITGSLDTWGGGQSRAVRTSWTGGTMSGLVRPAETMLLAEIPAASVPMIPGGSVDSEGTGYEVRVYPPAIREFWRYKLMDGDVSDCANRTKGTVPDPKKIASGGIIVGFTDGSAKFLTAGEFLRRTPTKQEYLGVTGGATAGWSYQNDCVTLTAGNLGFAPVPRTTIDYPFWGLGQ